MRTFTMPGVAPDPNWQRLMDSWGPIQAEPVFQLTRKHDVTVLDGFRDAIPAFTVVPSCSRVQSLSTRRPVLAGSRRRASELDEGAPIAVRASRRRVVVRFAGLFVLAAALFGSGLVVRDPVAGREALSWATMGHADVVLGVVHRLLLLRS
jgi:hypothetical protein